MTSAELAPLGVARRTKHGIAVFLWWEEAARALSWNVHPADPFGFGTTPTAATPGSSA